MAGSEIDVAPLTSQESRATKAFYAAFWALTRRFDADLQREHRLVQSEYIVLDWLASSPGHALGLSELAGRCRQSLSAVSRTVGRLESRGLLRREQSAHDGRAFNATLTDAGKTLHTEASVTHISSLRDYLFANLGDISLAAFGAAMERMTAAADRTTAKPEHRQVP